MAAFVSSRSFGEPRSSARDGIDSEAGLFRDILQRDAAVIYRHGGAPFVSVCFIIPAAEKKVKPMPGSAGSSFIFMRECDMMIKLSTRRAFMWASELQLQNIARTCAGLVSADAGAAQPPHLVPHRRSGCADGLPKNAGGAAAASAQRRGREGNAVSARRGDERSGAGRADCRRWSSA